MTMYPPLLRYLGGKYKLRNPILAELLRLVRTKHCYATENRSSVAGRLGLI